MSHADEGLIHAYLDGVLADADPARTSLEAHLRECEACRAQLDSARDLRARVEEVLDHASPLGLVAPPFESVLERAGRPGSGGEARTTGITRRRFPLAWAASLALALAAGWLARDLFTRYGVTDLNLRGAVSEAETGAANSDAAPGRAVPTEPEARALGQASAPPAGTGEAVDEANAGERFAATPPPARPDQQAAGAARANTALDAQAKVAGAMAPLLEATEPTSVIVLHEGGPADRDQARRELSQESQELATGPPAWWSATLFAAVSATSADAWTPATREQAEVHLGQSLVLLPGITPTFEVAEVNGTRVVRSVTELADGAAIELIQSPAPAGAIARDAVAAQSFADVMSNEVDAITALPWSNAETDRLFGGRSIIGIERPSLRAVLIATLPADSLTALAGSMR